MSEAVKIKKQNSGRSNSRSSHIICSSMSKTFSLNEKYAWKEMRT